MAMVSIGDSFVVSVSGQNDPWINKNITNDKTTVWCIYSLIKSYNCMWLPIDYILLNSNIKHHATKLSKGICDSCMLLYFQGFVI